MAEGFDNFDNNRLFHFQSPFRNNSRNNTVMRGETLRLNKPFRSTGGSGVIRACVCGADGREGVCDADEAFLWKGGQNTGTSNATHGSTDVYV